MLNPAGVRIGHEPVAGLKLRRDGENARDVHIRITADFELACGFYDHSTFTRTFRTMTGVTPTQFRAG